MFLILAVMSICFRFGEIYVLMIYTPMNIIERSPKITARIAGLIYVVVFSLGIFSLFSRNAIEYAAAMISGLFYIAVTILFYFIFKPAGPRVSFIAAVLSLAGIAIGPLSLLIKPLGVINPLVFFGFYCTLIGYLIFRSTFLPKFLGVLMVFAGLGWVTFVKPSFALSLAPYVYLPGIIGEGMLTLWLVLFGVNEQRWKKRDENMVASSESCFEN